MTAQRDAVERHTPAPLAAVRSPLAWLAIADSILRARVSELLERVGYTIDALVEPRTVPTRLADTTALGMVAHRPTIVVIDLDTIGANRVELLSEARTAAPGVPIVALLNDDALDAFDQESNLSINVLFVKPFELGLLRTAATTFARYP